MKLLFFVLLASVFASAAVTSPIARDGSCAAATTNCTLASPTPTVGDLVITYAYRSTTTAPSLPAGWTSIATASASGSSFRVGCQKLASGAASGTWTNATHVVSIAYKNVFSNTFATANCNSLVVGTNTTNSATASTTMTFSTIAPKDKSGLSWVLIFGADLTVAPCSPAGMSAVANVGAGPGVNALDTSGGVTSFGSKTCSVASTSWRSATLEIMAAPCGTGNVYGNWSCVSYTSAQTTNVVAFPSNTAGNLLVGCGQGNAATFAAPTDANTNTWIAAGPGVLFNASAEQIQCWAVLSAKADASSNTVTFDGGIGHGVFVAEFHNANPAAFDQSSSQPNATSNGTTGAITATSFTPGSANELIIGAVNTSAGQFNKTGTIAGGDNPVLVGLGTENPILVFSTQASTSAIAMSGIDSSISDAYGWLQLSFSGDAPATCSSSFFALLGAGCR